MEILTKQFILDKPESITTEYIEDFIKKSGYTPLRWAIVKSENNKLTVDTVVILD
ncbi:MAG: hypothetical protein ACD_20C00300G0002 [uncultured bacterium]|nr:MAG: hypothetical protein ACD_20C00300G0002 [uncultured bacterium]